MRSHPNPTVDCAAALRFGILLRALSSCVLLAVLAGCSPIRWESDAQSGLAKAAETRQRALLQFVSGYDEGAAQMDEEVFSEASVQDLVREFVPIRVNILWNKQLAEKFNIQKTPAFIVLRPDMSLAGRYEGVMKTEQFRTFLIRNRLR